MRRKKQPAPQPDTPTYRPGQVQLRPLPQRQSRAVAPARNNSMTGFRSARHPKHTQTAATKTTDKSKQITINLALPSLEAVKSKLRPLLARLRRWYRFARKHSPAILDGMGRMRGIIIACAVALTLVIAAITYSVIIRSQPTEDTRTADEKASDEAAKKFFPEYDTILPTDKNIDQLGGWSRVSPDAADPVFAYADKIDDVNIAVSQQPLPQKLRDEPEKSVPELAKSFGANEEINVDSTTVYIGTSGDGPQSVIFYRDKLLVLIKSDNIISDDSWTAYIRSLR